MKLPNNWKHKEGYHLNADGKSMEYIHENKQLIAIVECMYNESDIGSDIQYYTFIFDKNKNETIEYHELHSDKENAKSHLKNLMEKYN